MLLTGPIYGVLTMLFFGTGDFFAKLSVEKINELKTAFYIQLTGLIASFAFLPLQSTIPSLNREIILLFISTSLFYTVGYYMFIKALKYGKISLIVPIANSGGAAFAIVLSYYFHGERLNLVEILGILIVFLGVTLSSIDLGEIKETRRTVKFIIGLNFAIIAIFCFGFTWFLYKPLVSEAGELLAFTGTRLLTVLYLLAISLTTKLKINEVSSGKHFSFSLVSGVSSMAGNLTFMFGLGSGVMVSLMTPIATSYPALTLLFGYLFLGERVLKHQKIGVLTVLIGLVALAL